MPATNISRDERNSRLVMALILFISVALHVGPWFYFLMAALLGFSGVTGQCGIIKVMSSVMPSKK